MSQSYINQIKIKTKSIQFRKYSTGTLNSLLRRHKSKDTDEAGGLNDVTKFYFLFLWKHFQNMTIWSDSLIQNMALYHIQFRNNYK